MNNIIHNLKHRRLIETILAHPDKDYSIRSLAKESGIPYATAWRFIKSIEKMGAIKTKKVGAVCLVFPDTVSAIWNELIKVADIETEPLIASIKKDFDFIKKEVGGVLLYGSQAKGRADERSDIDICIVKPQEHKILERVYKKLGNKYDIKVFEELPLYLKMDVIDNYKIIFGSEPEISYYFYGFRKLGMDIKNRILVNRFLSARDMILTRKRWLNARR